MKYVIQRINSGSVKYDGCNVETGFGLAVFSAFLKDDTKDLFEKFFDKIINLRTFPDKNGKMEYSVSQKGGSILLIPNFTVAGTIKKGRRPDFSKAMPSPEAAFIFRDMVRFFESRYDKVFCGSFGADMTVDLSVDGPVTYFNDTN